jgi:ubiquinone/menaquinone biosynthesis C-methylase UbiE
MIMKKIPKQTNNDRAIYGKFAEYYDLLYSSKDYATESREIADIINSHLKISDKTLLDVGCGTAKHLIDLQKSFDCTGLDRSKAMLAIAKKNAPDIPLVKGDMLDFNLGKQFGAVVSLFSVIGYARTLSNLRKAIITMNNHLLPGGVMLIHPWHNKKTYKPGSPHMTVYDGKDIKIARLSISELASPKVSRLVMEHTVAERNKKIFRFTDIHEMGLFSKEDTLPIFQSLGLKAKFQKEAFGNSRGLYIVTKPL